MWKKLFILSLSITVLFVFSAPISSVDAGGKWGNWGKRKINWRVAGSIINTVSVKNYGAPSDQTLINLKAIGSPGRADLTVLGLAGAPDFSGIKGCAVYVPFLQDEFVAVFNDLSMLFAQLDDDETAGDSYLCVKDGVTTFIFEMKITGGTGRFDGAEGYFTATGVGYGQYFEGPLSAESGEFIGEIYFE